MTSPRIGCLLLFATSSSLLVLACDDKTQTPAVALSTADAHAQVATGTQVGMGTQVGVTSAQGVDRAVVEQLSSARCDQEQGCKNIGAGAKFDTRQVCMDQLRGSIGNDLNAYRCPRGLAQAGIDRCMASIEAEECNHPFDTLTRYDTCRTDALCMK